MRTEVKKLIWDSDFFGKKIGEISGNLKGEIITDETFDCIVAKPATETDLKIEGYHQTYREIKVIYRKKIELLSELSSEIFDYDRNPTDWEAFRSLAYESGKHSRFLKDEKFGETNFRKLYDEWIINSLNKKFADKVFYILEAGVPISFVTVQQEDNKGKIGLIATLPDHQGKGYGKRMLNAAETYCKTAGLRFLEIPTQKENARACGFYEKMGYLQTEHIIIKHFWKC